VSTLVAAADGHGQSGRHGWIALLHLEPNNDQSWEESSSLSVVLAFLLKKRQGRNILGKNGRSRVIMDHVEIRTGGP
jgi:hypothetical protein